MLLASTAAQCCRLCAIARGMPQAQGVDRPWLLDENYAAFVSVGALVPGWSLVAPKQHGFNLSTYYSKNSFWQFVDRAVDVVERTYGRAVIFEHGSVDAESMTSCGTAHAHLHIVPLSFELSAKAIGFDQGLQWEECSIVDVARRAAGREYLFMADRYASMASRGWLTVLKQGTSQYFRRVIAHELRRPEEFDYKLHPQTDTAESSAKLLLSAAAASGLAAVA